MHRSVRNDRFMEKTFADQFTESEHLEEKTFTESPLAKPISVAHYNFNFHGARVAPKHSKIHECFLPEKFPTI